MKYVYLIALLMAALLVISGCLKNNLAPEPVACTEEAKLCSDGTAVVRNASNNCEFNACPEVKSDGKLQAIDCVERPQACTREYMPVCGQVQVQCIRAPCPPIMQTFSNKCEACANSLTISYTEGMCANDAS